MIKDGVCPECGSTDILPDLRIADRGHNNLASYNLSIAIFEQPATMLGVSLWQSESMVPLRAWICAACGYTALFATEPNKLLQVYRSWAKE